MKLGIIYVYLCFQALLFTLLYSVGIYNIAPFVPKTNCFVEEYPTYSAGDVLVM